LSDLFDPTPIALPEPKATITRTALFKIFEPILYNNDEFVINTNFIDKMQLVHGTPSNTKDHLAFRISTANTQDGISNLLQTEAGKFFLVNKLSQPHTNITQITKGTTGH